MATHDPKTGALTREGMVQSIKDGKSFIYKGQIVSSLTDPAFPSAADLAHDTGDSSELERVRKENLAKIEELQRENEALKKGKTATPVATPSAK